ncbi:response regulator [Ideonella sp. DXS29W]|uniref:Response regulator n=1 Tax=Ideonella lacteola TaxID=2984193 RepID=A0ABU9BZI8_9BURK
MAVLDDDSEYGVNMAIALKKLGLETDAYASSDAFLAAVREGAYDAYVVDWLLADGLDAEATCHELRRLAPTAPVILLTGQLNNAQVSESSLLRVAEAMSVELCEKPTRLSFLAAKLRREVHARAAQSAGD